MGRDSKYDSIHLLLSYYLIWWKLISSQLRRWWSFGKCLRYNELNIDGLVLDCINSIANSLELLQSCTKPSTCTYLQWYLGEYWLIVIHITMDIVYFHHFGCPRTHLQRHARGCLVAVTPSNGTVCQLIPARTKIADNEKRAWNEHMFWHMLCNTFFNDLTPLTHFGSPNVIKCVQWFKDSAHEVFCKVFI